MNISDYLRTALLSEGLGVGEFTKPTAIYAALFSSTPTSAGGGTEFNAVDYTRIAVTFEIPSTGLGQNTADIRFPASGGALHDWGTATTLVLFDAQSNGNMLWFGDLSAGVSVATGNDFKIPAGSLQVQLS